MKFRTVPALVLAAVLLLLPACGSDDESSASASTDDSSASASAAPDETDESSASASEDAAADESSASASEEAPAEDAPTDAEEPAEDAPADDEATDVAPADDGAADDGGAGFPLTFEHDNGTTEIPAQPQRVVATSVSLVGTLLAMDVPLVASAATSVNPLTDDKGFFSQWAEAADERGVEVLYPNLELDIEAVELTEPDLIIGSSVGGDSTLEAYDQLSEVAPTILFNYGSASWDQIALRIGEATGLTANAEAAIAEFDAYVAEQGASIVPPEGSISLITYQGADGIAVFNLESPQATILDGLGFDVAEGPDDIAAQARDDANFYTQENMAAALADTETLFVIPLGGPAADTVSADPLLSTVPAVAAGNVVDVTVSSFRIDPFSGRQLVDLMVELYGG